jgi:arylsulfatase A-like enzyme
VFRLASIRASAVAVLVPLLAACGGRARDTDRPPIVVIVVDTLRADRLPAYGYTKVETPNVDALVADGILFENAYTHVPLTLPAHASLFTGLLPAEHGVRDNLGYRLDAGRHATLAARLRERGYATGGAISAWVLRGATGMGAGFDFYEDSIEAPAGVDVAGAVQRPGGKTLDRLLPWLEQAQGRPFFLFFHIYEPHSPFEPPEPWKSRYADPYDGEVAASDAIVGRLLDELRRRGVYDRALVVFLSDHGEGLGDHGEEFHGILLYREVLRVPLVVKLPGQARAAQRVPAPVPLVDVAPTLLEAAGVDLPKGLAGRSLLEPRESRPVYSETYYPRVHLGWSELKSVVDGQHHYIEAPRPELYDVVADPRQTRDLVADRRDVVRALRLALSRFPSDFSAPEASSREEREKLAALGYLGGAAASTSGPRPNPRDRIHVLDQVKVAFGLSAGGRDAEAVVALRGILETEPDFLDVLFELGRVLQRTGRSEEAYAAYVRGIRASPVMAPALAIPLARVCLDLERLDEARKNAELGMESNPGAAHEILARLALARQDLAEAEAHLTKVTGDSVAEVNALLLRAEIEIRREKPAGALAHLDGAERLVAGRAMDRPRDLSFLRGDALARLGRHAEAAAAFEREIGEHPANAKAYARLAIVYGLLHKTYGEVDRLLERMFAASRSAETAELAAQTMESLSDPRGARRWKDRAARLRARGARAPAGG